MVSPILAALDQVERTTKSSKTYLAGTRDLSYGTLFDRVARLTTLFRNMGLQRDDRAVVSSKDDPSLVTLYVALVRNGVTAVVLDPDAPLAELRKLVEAADAKALFLDAGRATAADLQGVLRPDAAMMPIGDEATKRPSFLGFGKSANGSAAVFPAILAGLAPSAPSAEGISDSTIAYILFTSGTTSKPKGVEITHRNLYAQMQTFIRHYGLTAQSRLMNLLPLHHTDGLTHGAFVSLLAGMTLDRPWRFSVDVLPMVPSLRVASSGPQYRDSQTDSVKPYTLTMRTR